MIMCAYYEDGTTRIKAGDSAHYLNRPIVIQEAKHLKARKMMRIVYLANEKEITLEVPYKTVMEGMKRAEPLTQSNHPKINEMGQEVVEGYACKPKDFDPNRPIMHFKYQIFICDDERCAKAAGEDTPLKLRELLKEMELNKGKNRIKISRSGCFGACRYRQVAECIANTRANGRIENNAVWLSHTHRWDEATWREVFQALAEDKPLEGIIDSKHRITMKVYE